MNDSVKKVVAVLILIIIAFSWFITLKESLGGDGSGEGQNPIGSLILKGAFGGLGSPDTEKLETERKDLMDRTQAKLKSVWMPYSTNPNVAIEGAIEYELSFRSGGCRGSH